MIQELGASASRNGALRRNGDLSKCISKIPSTDIQAAARLEPKVPNPDVILCRIYIMVWFPVLAGNQERNVDGRIGLGEPQTEENPMITPQIHTSNMRTNRFATPFQYFLVALIS